MPEVVGIIPARYASSRLPGKLLLPINGIPLIQRTYENAKLSDALDRLIVATDSTEIKECVESFGGEVVMTSPSCPNGTERLADAIQKNPSLQTSEIIVNIQGDWPLIAPDVITRVVEALRSDNEAAIGTAVVRLTDPNEIERTSLVKCVLDRNHRALYFSRSIIPFSKNGQANVYGHLGIYSYRPSFLLHYAQLKPTPLQQAEDLEQLKALEYGHKIAVAIVDSPLTGVDTIEDLNKVEEFLCNQSISSQQAALSPH